MGSTTSFPSLKSRESYQFESCEGRTFPETVKFDLREFHGPLNFQGCTFEKGVIFNRCVFKDEVSFAGAHFHGTARFWKNIFEKKADFTWAVIHKREQGALDSIYNGEANFSWSQFKAPVDFYGVQFQGPVFFWRTIFHDNVKMEARFESEVIFEANPDQVCLEALDFTTDPGLFYALDRIGLLAQDKENSACATMPKIKSIRELERRLQEAGWSQRHIEDAKSVWSNTAVDMFSAQGAFFRGAYFAKPDSVEFRNINLKTCSLANSNVGQVNFQNVEWDRQPTFLWATSRRAVYDERTSTSIESLRATGRLYYELRLNHEKKGLYNEASDFYYGEMEMKRLSQPAPLRYISLVAWYRYLGAYGERPGLALCWLAIAIFILFPLLYIAIGFSPTESLLHSLETSTFLEKSKTAVEGSKAAVPILTRFVAGFQRIVVPLLAGMFLLAVQRKFGRK